MIESQEPELPPPPFWDETEDDYKDDNFFATGRLWRDNGATSIIIKSLKEVVHILNLMIKEGHKVDQKLSVYYTKYLIPFQKLPEESDEEFEKEVDELVVEFSEICGRYQKLENGLESSVRTAILMAAIDLEACVNKCCFYNLGDVDTEQIEKDKDGRKKSLRGKLKRIHEVLELSDSEETVYNSHVKPLRDWRDAFAHGKNPDMPKPNLSIKNNHLKALYEPTYSSPIVSEMLELLSHYIVVYRHLDNISKQPIYTFGNMTKLSNIEEQLSEIRAIWSKSSSIIEKVSKKIAIEWYFEGEQIYQV